MKERGGKEGIKHEGRERRAETKIISIDRPRQRVKARKRENATAIS